MNSSLHKLPQGFWRAVVFIIIAGIIIWGSIPRSAEAHTAGKMQLAAEPAGPFMMTIWTSPDPARVGEVHVALALVLADDASPILDADVIVRLSQVNGSQMMEKPAKTDDSENKFLYEAVFDLEEPGPYLVDVSATGEDGDTGAVSFELNIESAPAFNWLYLIPIALAAGAIALIIYAIRQRPKEV